MYNTIQDLMDVFRATPDSLQGLLNNVSQEQARAARGGDENWSVIEVLCHMRDAEEHNLKRFHLMRTQEMPLLAGYDQEVLAKEGNYAAADLSEALAAYLKFRTATLAELSALAPADWDRPGRHSEKGEITIMNYAIHIAAHDSVHLAQIARQLRGLK
jgi:uncharacterized damage-inducible protein DinB